MPEEQCYPNSIGRSSVFGSSPELGSQHLFPGPILIYNLPVKKQKTLNMVSVSSMSPSKLSNMRVVFKLPPNSQLIPEVRVVLSEFVPSDFSVG